MPTVYKEVEVEVSLEDFDDDHLIQELESREIRDYTFKDAELVSKIYEKRRLNKDYQQELDELIYSVTGKIV